MSKLTEEIKYLKTKGFELWSSNEFAIDFERIVHGFGTDNEDRLERVSFVENDGGEWTCYGVAVHTDFDGDVWYDSNSESVMKPQHLCEPILAWLAEDRKTAPRKKDDTD